MGGEEEAAAEDRPNSRARLDKFLTSLEAAHVLSHDDVNSFFAPLPPLPVSVEMDDRMREVLEKHLGSGPWQDVVGSTLARPLDPSLVFCDEAAQLSTATVGPCLPPPETEEEEGGSGGAVPHLEVQSSLSSTLPIVENLPRTQFLQRLAEEHRREGRTDEALACLREAAALLEQKEVVLPPQASGALFPYSQQVFKAARLIQRLGRRRLQHKHRAATTIASHFKGFRVRRGRVLLAAKQLMASKIIQRKYRRHYRVLIRCAMNVQRVSE